MFYQKQPYFTGDKIKVLQCKYTQFSKLNAIFIIPTLERAFSSFSWGSSSFNVKVIEETKITLPTKNGTPRLRLYEHLHLCHSQSSHQRSRPLCRKENTSYPRSHKITISHITTKPASSWLSYLLISALILALQL